MFLVSSIYVVAQLCKLPVTKSQVSNERKDDGFMMSVLTCKNSVKIEVLRNNETFVQYNLKQSTAGVYMCSIYCVLFCVRRRLHTAYTNTIIDIMSEKEKKPDPFVY